MRNLKFVEHISIDGFPNTEWTAPYQTPAGLAVLLERYGEKFDLLLGRDQVCGETQTGQSGMGSLRSHRTS
jgi:hypothetical protein